MGTVSALVIQHTRGSVSAETTGIFLDASCRIRIFAFTAGHVLEYFLPDGYAAADASPAISGILSYVSLIRC
jgi:hypothetical protein